MVIKDFQPERGGVERFAHQFVSQSRAKGHELHVFANRWDREGNGGFFRHRVPALRWPSLAKLISFPLNAHRLLKDLGPFDIVFALTPLFDSDVYRLGEGIHREVLQRRYRTQLGRLWKRFGIKSQYLLWMENRMFSSGHLRKVIAISEASRRQLLSYYPIPKEQVVTIYNGVDLERFNPRVREGFRRQIRNRWGVGEGEWAVLFIGNDFRRKGLLPLIRAMGLLRETTIPIIEPNCLAGDHVGLAIVVDVTDRRPAKPVGRVFQNLATVGEATMAIAKVHAVSFTIRRALIGHEGV